MTLSRSLARPLARPLARSLAGTLGGAAWNPANIAGVLQVLKPYAYAGSTVGGLPVLESSIGTLAQPRGQRCVLFDGTDDYAISGANVSLNLANSWTVTCKFRLSTVASATDLFGFGDSSAAGIALVVNPDRLAYVGIGYIGADLVGPTLSVNTWYSVAVVKSGSTITVYVDGVSVGTYTSSPTASSELFEIGSIYFSAVRYTRSEKMLSDVRVYSVAKTVDECLAIHNQHLTPTTLDRTGLVAAWWLNEEAGTTHYDWSGNGNDLTATNVTVGTYHATDSGVKYNAANSLGHTLTGSTIIPRDESDTTKDVLGADLEYSGPIQLPIAVEVPCFTSSGTDWIDFQSQLVPGSGDWELNIEVLIPAEPSIFSGVLGQADIAWTSAFLTYFQASGDWRVVYGSYLSDYVSFSPPINSWFSLRLRKVGTTLYASVDGGATESSSTCAATIAVTEHLQVGSNSFAAMACRVANLQITVGGVTKSFPLQDGPGSSNTNRDVAWVGSDGTGGVISGAVVNGTVANIWANRTAYVEDWCIKYGGRIPNQNLLTYSEQLNQVSWTTLNTSVTANTTTAPDGTMTADKFVEDNQNANHLIYQATSMLSGLTFSIYAKASERSILGVSFSGGGDYGIYVDLTNGTFVSNMQNPPTSYSIQSVGDGWYRIAVYYNGSTSNPFFILSDGSPTTARDAYLGDGVSGVYVWGAQMHEGSTLLDYEKTVASAHDGEFILGIPDSTLCADGNAKTLPAASHNNPWTRLVPNNWSAPSLVNIGSTSSDKYAPSDMAGVQAESVADTRYASDTGYLSFAAALTGSDKTNAEGYVS